MPLNLLANIFVSSKRDYVSVPTVVFLEVDKHMETWIKIFKRVNIENKRALNNAALPSLFNVVNNVDQYC